MNQTTMPQVLFSEEKPLKCEYCYHWGGMRKGCLLGGENHCAYIIRKKKPKRKSRCSGCPYGRDSPCIGWCTVDAMKFVFKDQPGEDADADVSTEEVSVGCR